MNKAAIDQVWRWTAVVLVGIFMVTIFLSYKWHNSTLCELIY